MDKKVELRNRYLNIRNDFSEERILLSSKKIEERFFALDIIHNSKDFLLYHSFRKEIVTHGIIDRLLSSNNNVYLPYIKSREKKELEIGRIYSNDDFVTGAFGIQEPRIKKSISINKMDVIIVPGLLFSVDGFRLGYGGGYYDRLLANIMENTITIGLAYDDFLQDVLPIDKYDIPVKIIVTEEQTLFTGGEED